MHRLLKHLYKQDAGGTLVEFSVCSLLLLMIIFAILDCSRALYFDHYVRYSAEEAARYAMVRGATWNNAVCTSPSTESCTATSANVSNLVQSITPMGSPDKLSVTTQWTGKTPAGKPCSTTGVNNGPGCVVQVQVSYSFNFVLPLLPKNALLISSTSSLAISQ